jgi:hypothetical protein
LPRGEQPVGQHFTSWDNRARSDHVLFGCILARGRF